MAHSFCSSWASSTQRFAKGSLSASGAVKTPSVQTTVIDLSRSPGGYPLKRIVIALPTSPRQTAAVPHRDRCGSACANESSRSQCSPLGSNAPGDAVRWNDAPSPRDHQRHLSTPVWVHPGFRQSSCAGTASRQQSAPAEAQNRRRVRRCVRAAQTDGLRSNLKRLAERVHPLKSAGRAPVGHEVRAKRHDEAALGLRSGRSPPLQRPEA